MMEHLDARQRQRVLHDRLQAGVSDDERQFLEAAEIGNFDVIKNKLESGLVKIDCCDQQGRTALELAVSGDDVDIVCYLLKISSHRMIHKALLCAADNDIERISELILDHPMYRDALHRNTRSIPMEDTFQTVTSSRCTEGTLIPTVPTAEDGFISQEHVNKLLREVLLRAAKRNNFQIVKKVLMHGVYLSVPHDYFCSCDECSLWRREDFKVFTTQRLDTFAALASPCYIALTEEDPILAAFYLSQKFRSLSEIEGEYKNVYQQLDQQTQAFTLHMLDQCQSSDEVKTVLNGSCRKNPSGNGGSGFTRGSSVLPLVHTALRMEQKKFVAHPQCQGQIGELWFSGVPFLRYLNRFLYLMLAIPIGVFVCPLMSFLYILAPCSKIGKIVNTPLMKFLSYTCSYLTFLILIITSRLYLRFSFSSFVCDDPPLYAYAHITIILMWIFGLIWEEAKQVWLCGAYNYFYSLWNVIDSVMLSLLLAAFVLEIVIPLRINFIFHYSVATYQNVTQPPQPRAHAVEHLCAVMFESTSSKSVFCEAENARKSYLQWKPSWIPDPELLSDIMFTFGVIMSISRFSFIMPANEALGTMLVSFRRTIADLFKITGMFVLVLMCFACGIATLYAPSHCATDRFNSFSNTLFTLTWSVFGMGNTGVPELQDSIYAPSTTLTNHPTRSSTVESVGFYLYGIYVFASMIVLLNLLIAVMSNTFNEVQDERDVEWKFARTDLWMSFIEPGTPVPPPFNVIPSPMTVFGALLWLCRRSKFRRCLPHEGKEVKYAAVQTGMDFIDSEHECNTLLASGGKHTREDVICSLCRRYVREMERKKIEGDGEKVSTEEHLRRVIERMSTKLEKRVDDVSSTTGKLVRDLEGLRQDTAKVLDLQATEIELVRVVTDTRHGETDKYCRKIDENKLDIMARLDAERLQMERVLRNRLHDLHEQMYTDQQLLFRQLKQYCPQQHINLIPPAQISTRSDSPAQVTRTGPDRSGSSPTSMPATRSTPAHKPLLWPNPPMKTKQQFGSAISVAKNNNYPSMPTIMREVGSNLSDDNSTSNVSVKIMSKD